MGSATVQGALWGQKAADWAEVQEPQHLNLYVGALESCLPLAGKRLMDAGCGSGMALALAAERGARVTGMDASEALLGEARKRVPDAELHVGDVEACPFPDGSFDVVTAFNSIQYADDPVAALRELRRVVRAGGRVVIGQWSDPAQCETEPLFDKLGALTPRPAGTPAPLALSGAGQLELRLVEASLSPVGWGEAVCYFEYRDLDTAWRGMGAAGPVSRLIGIVGEEVVRKTVTDFFRTAEQADGRVVQRNTFRWVIAQ